MWLCSGSPSGSTLLNSTSQKRALGSFCRWSPHLPPHPSQGHQSLADPWPGAPHLVQGTDFLLALNVVFIICKDLKPEGEQRGRKLHEIKGHEIRARESEAASRRAWPQLPRTPAQAPPHTRPLSPVQPSSPTCTAPWPISSPVVVHEHVDNVLEQVWLFGGEETTAQLLNDVPKLRNSVIVLLGVVAVGEAWSALWPGVPGSSSRENPRSPKPQGQNAGPSLLLPCLELLAPLWRPSPFSAGLFVPLGQLRPGDSKWVRV